MGTLDNRGKYQCHRMTRPSLNRGDISEVVRDKSRRKSYGL